MKRRLILMRHAKSAWDTDAPSDHARPLNKRGRRDAPRIGERLVEIGWEPELVLSSDSTRTKETWERMSSSFERPEIHFLPSLYGAGVATVRAELARVPAEVGTVLLLGHNPGWEEVLAHLTGSAQRMTTANAALLSVGAASWSIAADAEAGWRLDQLLRPKEL
ncbi:MAG: histidine phosphatase family protein [Deltaproteobacteria bacterium]|jgi:phosphohistidine phosphatase SixA|nr:histidine phosphatase family protein [Deltaproteobacteria bacterium]MBW2537001.1 histidine phosphatase family protein [Deltaproteobacteria bacterium]